MATSPYCRKINCSAALALFAAAVPFICKSGLLNPCAATLNENRQYDYGQNTGNYPDNCGTVHCGILPLRKSYLRCCSLRNPGLNAGPFGAKFPGLRNCRTGQRPLSWLLWLR